MIEFLMIAAGLFINQLGWMMLAETRRIEGYRTGLKMVRRT